MNRLSLIFLPWKSHSNSNWSFFKLICPNRMPDNCFSPWFQGAREIKKKQRNVILIFTMSLLLSGFRRHVWWLQQEQQQQQQRRGPKADDFYTAATTAMQLSCCCPNRSFLVVFVGLPLYIERVSGSRVFWGQFPLRYPLVATFIFSGLCSKTINARQPAATKAKQKHQENWIRCISSSLRVVMESPSQSKLELELGLDSSWVCL